MKKSILVVEMNKNGFNSDETDLVGQMVEKKETIYYHKENDFDTNGSPFKALEFEIEDPYMNCFYNIHVDAYFFKVSDEEITIGFEGEYGEYFKVHFKNDLSVYAERFTNQEEYESNIPYLHDEWKTIKEEYIFPTIIPWDSDLA